MSKIRLSIPYPFFPYADDIRKSFSAICRGVLLGDNVVFDKFCQRIYPFCLEIHNMGKDLVFTHEPVFPEEPEVVETPTDWLIFSVGANISPHVLPIYKNYLTKSDALYEMVRNVLNDETLGRGRGSFITEIWYKTKRTDGIDVKKLLSDKSTGSSTVRALLKLKDGRFVKEVRKLQKQVPDDWYKKKISLYIERYGNTEQ